MPHASRIGFIQGRLSPMVNGMIQAFPAKHWREEFPTAQTIGVQLMEWTLDQNELRDNPYTTQEGQAEIKKLCAKHSLSIPSVTGDCFMQAPFWKAEGQTRDALLKDFSLVVESSAALGVTYIVVPLVDNGSIETAEQADNLKQGLAQFDDQMRATGVKIVFESDFAPAPLAEFIANFDTELYGINYDIGNSAALGFSCDEEFQAYGDRILNVHIKDRILGGTTVPLGTGDAYLPKVMAGLVHTGYTGYYILQTARAEDDSHAQTLARFRDMAAHWLKEALDGYGT